MVCRMMMQCADTPSAVAVLHRFNTCSSMNYLLADSAGTLADVETDGRTPCTIHPEVGVSWLAHANHYEHADHLVLNSQKDAAGLQDSELRVSKAREIYTATPPTSVESVFDALGTLPIYREKTDARPPHSAPSETVVSFVAYMTDGE